MLHFRWAVATLLGMLVVFAPSLSARAAKGEKNRKLGKAAGGYYGIMANILKLSPEQVEKVAAAVKSRRQALAAWNESEKGRKLAALKKELAALVAERKKVKADARARFDGALAQLLSPGQLAAWRAYEVRNLLMRRFKRTGLSNEQAAKIKAMCASAGKGLTSADSAARRAIVARLAARITKKVLDDRQRGRLDRPRAKKPARPLKGKGIRARSRR